MSIDAETMARKADEIVQEIGIPPCPAILTKLLRETRADEPDFRRVGQLIGGDVALASAVLKVANSPFYGLRSKAASVQQALVLLGLNTVTQLVTGLLLRQAFSGSARPGMERYWKQSMATSLVSALLCRESGRGDSGVACTYGLFRDCGMPVMLQKFPIYEDIFDGSALEPGEPALELENERYLTNHAIIGERLAASWHLPDYLCFAILHHHDVPLSDELLEQAERVAMDLIAVGLAADKLYSTATGAACDEWERAGVWALSQLDLADDRFEAIGQSVKASINHL